MTPATPASPGELFRCGFYELSLLGSACLRRQTSDPENEENKHRFCASGECDQGCRVWQALKGEPRPPGRQVDVANLRVAAPRCGSCGRRLNAGNKSGVCAPDKQGRPSCRTRKPPAAFETRLLATVVEPSEPPPPAPVAPPPEPPRCEECGAPVEPGEDLCEGCRAEDQVLAAAAKPTRPAASPPPPEESPMPEKKKCSRSGCSSPAFARGLCRKDYDADLRDRKSRGEPLGPTAGPRTPKTDKPTKTSMRAGPQPRKLVAFPFVGAPQLPDVKQLPNEYLLKAVEELVRRRNELIQATRQLGLADSAA